MLETVISLFLTFFKIGLVSFGGGYGMLSLMREETMGHGWLTEENFLNFVAVSESTPGPIAVNMATFVGSSQAGALGAICATLGVVLPSFIIILLIASVIKNLLRYKGVQAGLAGVRPVVVGLIIATAITLLASSALHFKVVGDAVSFDWITVATFSIIVAVSEAYKRIKKKKISPILLIGISAVLGIIFCSV